MCMWHMHGCGVCKHICVGVCTYELLIGWQTASPSHFPTSSPTVLRLEACTCLCLFTWALRIQVQVLMGAQQRLLCTEPFSQLMSSQTPPACRKAVLSSTMKVRSMPGNDHCRTPSQQYAFPSRGSVNSFKQCLRVVCLKQSNTGNQIFMQNISFKTLFIFTLCV